MSGEEAKAKCLTGSWGMVGKLCDSCKSATASMFCRADSAFLCGMCDSKVHAANRLACRHARVWLCEVCEHAPAVVTCKADAAALCATCDREIHSANPLARRHERVPVTPFFDPAVAAKPPAGGAGLIGDPYSDLDADEAEAAAWILPDLKPGDSPDLNSEQFAFDMDPYLDLEYGSMDPKYQVQDSGGADRVVPEQSKNEDRTTNSVMVNGGRAENCFEFDFGGTNSKPLGYSYTAQSLSQSVSSSSLDVGVVPDGNALADISNPFGRQVSNLSESSANQPAQVSGMDREARVLRYREKRKNRKFEKTIRYASRKAYAETRPRIKGRFAKRSEIQVDVDPMYLSPAALVTDAGYGVVPSF
ncbi:zinc finger protein CONSTANS-LIKE 4 [Malania oleifera]|uniref:zinc finger protein CONSTANS-LIKE 4 n=1 Tax=Malania oleifera TaxID=397392 RepID=UPI0025AE446F|nr:zinc finger protein CONSTANS-LIKE 4 [Malania oleifera]